jgi:hypothetical protein
MTDIAIRVENCILSTSTTLSVDSVEGLSKLYHIGRAQGRHDTTSTRLSAGLRAALVSTFKRSNVLTMTDLAIRVENCILSTSTTLSVDSVEGLSKLYHIGRAQQRHDTLRDALTDFLPRISRKDSSGNSSNSWQRKDNSRQKGSVQ